MHRNFLLQGPVTRKYKYTLKGSVVSDGTWFPLTPVGHGYLLTGQQKCKCCPEFKAASAKWGPPHAQTVDGILRSERID